MSEASIPLGPFRLARRIGRGGMAEVWSGVHAAQGVPVAVKVMTGERYREAQHRAAFRNEVQSVASLDHPGVVLVYDHGEVGPEAEEASRGLLPAGSPFLAMELAGGGTLDDLFFDGLDWSALRAVLLSLLDALAHAHARGVIHRDLKPTNVLAFRSESGSGSGAPPRLKIADFGLAHVFELPARPESTQVVAGTPSYMAPEQLRGEWRDLGPWTDLYGLGCLAWSLATSRPPFEGLLLELVRRQLEEPPPELVPLHPMPPGFEAWLRRLLEKDPGHRFTRAADAAWALLALGETTGASGTPAARPAESAPPAPLETVPTLSILFLKIPEPAPPPPAGAEPPAQVVSPPLPATWEDSTEHPQSHSERHLLGAGLGLWGLRTVPFVGRRGERTFLWRALAEVHARRRPQAVVLVGAAGNGKTRLAEWIAERAHEVGGATVLRAAHGPDPGPADGLPRMLARHLRCVGLSRAEVLARAEHLLRSAGVSGWRRWAGAGCSPASIWPGCPVWRRAGPGAPGTTPSPAAPPPCGAPAWSIRTWP